MPLKLLFNKEEFDLDEKVTIGRSGTSCQIVISNDDAVSRQHCYVKDGFLVDLKSANGTQLNGHKITPHNPVRLRRKDRVTVGNTVLTLVEGWTAPRENRSQNLCETKSFGGRKKNRGKDRNDSKDSNSGGRSKQKDEKEKAPAKDHSIPDDDRTVEQLMAEEFAKIIGHDQIKTQLLQFHKKVQLDKIRAMAGRGADRKRLYHMMFLGPPGTGKTTMANLVGTIMVKMGIITHNKVVFVNNALDLLASYVGQTAPKVDAKVEEAKGGVLFIDEAYSIVKGESTSKGGGFGKEAIDSIMKHLDPPSCVFIFAGYEKEMDQFLKVNAGLARRIPYRYTFTSYNAAQLTEIFSVMTLAKGEDLEDGAMEVVPKLLATLSDDQIAKQNAGIISNWISFAQMDRDDRIDIDEARANPRIACLLSAEDLEVALEKVKTMAT